MESLVAKASRTALFHGIEPAMLSELLKDVAAAVRLYRKGEFVALEGATAHTVYVVVSGRLVITEFADGNRGHVVRDLGAGAGLGMTLILSPELKFQGVGNCQIAPYGEYLGPEKIPLWPGSAQAVEDSELIGFDLVKARNLFLSGRETSHRLLLNMTRVLCEHLANVWLKLSVMDAHSIEDRVMLYLNRMDIGSGRRGEVKIPFNRDQMARYLGVNRTALSRSLSRLRETGRIDWRKNAFRLLNGGSAS